MINEINLASYIDELSLTEFSSSIITYCICLMLFLSNGPHYLLQGIGLFQSTCKHNQQDKCLTGAKHRARMYKETSQILSENVSAAKTHILFQ